MAPPPKEPPKTFAARWAAMKNLPPFLAMVWKAAPALTAATVILRLLRALVPISSLWIGKLIIDEVIRLVALDGPETLTEWWSSGLTEHLAWLVALEFGLAIASDLLGRLVGLIDALLAERLTIYMTMDLMEHAASLDL